MENFEISLLQVEKATVFQIKGYCNAEAGKEIHRLAEEALNEGKISLVLDFSKCHSVNSPGAVAILDLSLKVVDDFQGRIIITGVNKSKMNFFSMAGIIPVAEIEDTVANACKCINGKKVS